MKRLTTWILFLCATTLLCVAQGTIYFTTDLTTILPPERSIGSGYGNITDARIYFGVTYEFTSNYPELRRGDGSIVTGQVNYHVKIGGPTGFIMDADFFVFPVTEVDSREVLNGEWSIVVMGNNAPFAKGQITAVPEPPCIYLIIGGAVILILLKRFRLPVSFPQSTKTTA